MTIWQKKKQNILEVSAQSKSSLLEEIWVDDKGFTKNWADLFLHALRESSGVGSWRITNQNREVRPDRGIVDSIVFTFLTSEPRDPYGEGEISVELRVVARYQSPNTIPMKKDTRLTPTKQWPIHVVVELTTIDTATHPAAQVILKDQHDISYREELEPALHVLVDPRRIVTKISGRVRDILDQDLRVPGHISFNRYAYDMWKQSTNVFNPKTGSGQPMSYSPELGPKWPSRRRDEEVELSSAVVEASKKEIPLPNLSDLSPEEIEAAYAKLSDTEKRQLGQQVSPRSASSYVSYADWPRQRAYMLKKSMHSNPTTVPELTAYTPGETVQLLTNPTIVAWHDRMAQFVIPPGYDMVVFVPCAKEKPWEGASCKQSLYKYYNVLRNKYGNIYFVTISEPLGVVPQAHWKDFPQYDNPGLFTDPVQRADMWTRDWIRLYPGATTRMQTPFDKDAYNKSIDLLAGVIRRFIDLNKKTYPNLKFVSFVEDPAERGIGTHADMLNRAQFSGERFAKAKKGQDPLTYLQTMLVKAGAKAIKEEFGEGYEITSPIDEESRLMKLLKKDVGGELPTKKAPEGTLRGLPRVLRTQGTNAPQRAHTPFKKALKHATGVQTLGGPTRGEEVPSKKGTFSAPKITHKTAFSTVNRAFSTGDTSHKPAPGRLMKTEDSQYDRDKAFITAKLSDPETPSRWIETTFSLLNTIVLAPTRFTGPVVIPDTTTPVLQFTPQQREQWRALAAANPNAPPSVLKHAPYLAPANPVLPLMGLEDPGLHQSEMERKQTIDRALKLIANEFRHTGNGTTGVLDPWGEFEHNFDIGSGRVWWSRISKSGDLLSIDVLPTGLPDPVGAVVIAKFRQDGSSLPYTLIRTYPTMVGALDRVRGNWTVGSVPIRIHRH